jgi:hypothetical protein
MAVVKVKKCNKPTINAFQVDRFRRRMNVFKGIGNGNNDRHEDK